MAFHQHWGQELSGEPAWGPRGRDGCPGDPEKPRGDESRRPATAPCSPGPKDRASSGRTRLCTDSAAPLRLKEEMGTGRTGTPLSSRPRRGPAPTSPAQRPGPSRPVVVSLGRGSPVSSRSDISRPQGELAGWTDPVQVRPPAQVRAVPETSPRSSNFCTIQSPHLASEPATHTCRYPSRSRSAGPIRNPAVPPSRSRGAGGAHARGTGEATLPLGAPPRGEPGVQLRRGGSQPCSGGGSRGGPGGPRHLWGPSSHGRRRGGSS